MLSLSLLNPSSRSLPRFPSPSTPSLSDPSMEMEFWGVEVKPGENLKCEPEENKYLHLSQVSLGETKGKGNENVVVHVKVNDKKLVLGTLSSEKCAQIQFDLVFEKEFELSHSSKNTSIYFCGYQGVGAEGDDGDEFSDGESDEEEVPVALNADANGKPVKQAEGKPDAAKANVAREDKSAAKKAKKAEPAKNEKAKVEDEDDEDEDDDDEDEEVDSDEVSDDDEVMAEGSDDSDDEDVDDDSDEEEEEATPKKAATGKRPAGSASKTPVPEKKAKLVTPGGQKTGGAGKKEVHVATPHPAKQAGKTPGNSEKGKQQTPKSGGSVKCKSCTKTFNSENALQSHTKAKHA